MRWPRLLSRTLGILLTIGLLVGVSGRSTKKTVFDGAVPNDSFLAPPVMPPLNEFKILLLNETLRRHPDVPSDSIQKQLALSKATVLSIEVSTLFLFFARIDLVLLGMSAWAIIVFVYAYNRRKIREGGRFWQLLEAAAQRKWDKKSWNNNPDARFSVASRGNSSGAYFAAEQIPGLTPKKVIPPAQPPTEFLSVTERALLEFLGETEPEHVK